MTSVSEGVELADVLDQTCVSFIFELTWLSVKSVAVLGGWQPNSRINPCL